jgi:hypothetical protein
LENFFLAPRTANSTPLAQLLLGKGSSRKEPLFSSQTDLVGKIVKQGGSYSSHSSLRSYLNQVLVGRRACSDSLEAEIQKAIENIHSVGKDEQSKIKEDLEAAVKVHNDFTVPEFHNLTPRAMQETRLEAFNKMRVRQAAAKSVFIINLEPLEISDDNSLAGETSETLGRKIPYVFCVGGRDTGILLWKAINKELGRNRTVTKRDALIKQLDEDDILKIYALPQRDCLHPVVVFDPDKRDATGYVWYVPQDPGAMAQFPDHVLQNWLRLYYRPIMAEEFGQQERIRWSNCNQTPVAKSK